MMTARSKTKGSSTYDWKAELMLFLCRVLAITAIRTEVR